MRMRLSGIIFALSALAVPGAFASNCNSTTDCIFTFDIHNAGFSGVTLPGPFGTVEFVLNGGNIDVTLKMNPDLVLIGTGFPATFGFNDDLELGDITAGSFSNVNYSGSTNNGGVDTTGGSGSDLHFDGFGYFDDAAATTAPSAGSSNAISTLTFVLSRTGGHTFSSVQQLIETPSGGGDGSPYFVADVFDKACGANGGTACTGLVGVSNLTSPVPEPSSYAFLGTGLLAMLFLIRRKRTSAQSIQ